MSAKIISIYSAKGGVGKTTSAVNLSYIFSSSGKKVLMVDMDPQGNLSRSFGISRDKIDKSILDCLVGDTQADEIIIKNPKAYENLDLLPCKRNANYREEYLYIGNLKDKEYTLKNVLAQKKDEYDYIFIDCPPSLSELTISALVFATDVIIPLKADIYSFDGIIDLSRKVEDIRLNFNPGLKFTGIFLTMYYRTKTNHLIKEMLEKNMKEKVFKTVIRQCSAIPEASIKNMPVIAYKENCNASLDYFNLAAELGKRM